MTTPRHQATITPSPGGPGVRPPGQGGIFQTQRAPLSLLRDALDARASDNRLTLTKPAAG